MFRYHFDGAFTTGVVDVVFGESAWNDSANAGNRGFTAQLRGHGRDRRPLQSRLNGRVGPGQLDNQGYIEIVFRPTAGSQIDHATIDGDEIVLRTPPAT